MKNNVQNIKLFLELADFCVDAVLHIIYKCVNWLKVDLTEGLLMLNLKASCKDKSRHAGGRFRSSYTRVHCFQLQPSNPKYTTYVTCTNLKPFMHVPVSWHSPCDSLANNKNILAHWGEIIITKSCSHRWISLSRCHLQGSKSQHGGKKPRNETF